MGGRNANASRLYLYASTINREFIFDNDSLGPSVSTQRSHTYTVVL